MYKEHLAEIGPKWPLCQGPSLVKVEANKLLPALIITPTKKDNRTNL